MSYELSPSDELASDELAALVAAAHVVLQVTPPRVPDLVPSWRFSGRWFNSGPYAMRRPNRPL